MPKRPLRLPLKQSGPEERERKMEWIEAHSSNVLRFSYDAESDALYVEFRNGTYRYDGVGESVFEAMKAAPSKGSFVAQSLKGVFPCVKV